MILLIWSRPITAIRIARHMDEAILFDAAAPNSVEELIPDGLTYSDRDIEFLFEESRQNPAAIGEFEALAIKLWMDVD